jgi:DNA-binding CsgD family transcriptional regulator
MDKHELQIQFLREAVTRLTVKQQAIWALYNEGLSIEKIAERLGITHQTVGEQLRAIEKNLKKWCKTYMKTYKALAGALPIADPDIENGSQEANGWAHKTPVRRNQDSL